MSYRHALVLLLFAPVACGYTDSGGGSKTIEVKAALEFEFDENTTEIEIVVNRDAIAQADFDVVIKDETNGGRTHDLGAACRAEPCYCGADPCYRMSVDGYIRRAKLTVERGSDKVEGKLEGPGSHRISDPENGETFTRGDIGDKLEVKWKTDDGIAADEVDIRLGHGDHSTTIREDPGHYDIPSSALADGDEDVQVARRNRVNLKGGIGQSNLTISYEVSNAIKVN